jgi:Amidohydrolase
MTPKLISQHELTRRSFLAALGSTPFAAACCSTRPIPIPLPGTGLVDVHCHLFNVWDIPLREFASKILSPRMLSIPADVLGFLVERVLKLGRASVSRELSKLDAMSAAGYDASNDKDSLERTDEQDEEETREFIKWLEREHPALYSASVRLERPNQTLSATAKRDALFLGALGRTTRWFYLMARYRFRIAEKYLQTYESVEVLCPSIVDFSLWLNASGTESIDDQLRLWARITRESRFAGRLKPFGTFCPLRDDALATLKTHRASIYGVKIYPPMGFAPHGNSMLIDHRLNELYEWCSAQSLPILAHTSESNGPSTTAEKKAHPKLWRDVLSDYPELRVCLGHTGDVDDLVGSSSQSEWARAALALIEDYQGQAFGDLGFTRVGFANPDDPEPEDVRLFAELRRRLELNAALGRGLCYASDWHMIRRLQGQGQYAERAQRNLREHIAPSAQVATDILRANAQRLLGA